MPILSLLIKIKIYFYHYQKSINCCAILIFKRNKTLKTLVLYNVYIIVDMYFMYSI